MQDSPFADPANVARYAEDTPRKVPGFADLHRMTMILLAETAPADARMLVVGAGGGLELKALATAQPGWTFVGVDPSAEMLDLARQILGPPLDRIDLRHGYVDDAPAGPFDGATCLLTLHFLSRDERLHTLREMHRRLKPGATLVVAHHTAPDGASPRAWLTRSAAFADAHGADFERASVSGATMVERLPLQDTAGEEALLRETGFSDIALFYAGFSFRGWVARS